MFKYPGTDWNFERGLLSGLPSCKGARFCVIFDLDHFRIFLWPGDPRRAYFFENQNPTRRRLGNLRSSNSGLGLELIARFSRAMALAMRETVRAPAAIF